MGLLDGILGSMGGGQSASPQLGSVLGALMGGGGGGGLMGGGGGSALGGLLGGGGQTGGLMGQGGGGLGGLMGLLGNLRNNGQGAAVDSWMGNGANQPIAPEHLRSALGDDQVQQMSQQAGMPAESFLGTLAQHLPGVVDHLSPNGQLQMPQSPGGTVEV